MLVVVGLAYGAVEAWLIWGTGLETARHQAELKTRFEAQYPTAVAPDPDSEPAPVPTSRPGEVVGRIIIDKIGLDAYVVHGTRYRDLKRGPGWVPGTAPLGTAGNSAISGHRTSYGAPFADIDDLEPEDKITIFARGRIFDYYVTATAVVRPENTSVLRTVSWSRSTLTLISCHPKYSSKKRIVVTAEQRTGAFAPADPAAVGGDSAVTSASTGDIGDTGFDAITGVLRAIIWIAIASLVVLLVAERAGARRPPSVATTPPATVDTFVPEDDGAAVPSAEEAPHH